MNLTINSIDAVTGQQINNGTFSLYKDIQNNKKQLKKIAQFEDAGSEFSIENLNAGTYYLVESVAPSYSVSVEDENCNTLTKTQTYQLEKETKIKIADNDLVVRIEHYPIQTSYSEVEENKKNRKKALFSIKQFCSLFLRNHELNQKEFKTVSCVIGAICSFCFIIELWLLNPLLQTLVFASKASSVAGVGYGFGVIATYFQKYLFNGYEAISQLNNANPNLAISPSVAFLIVLSLMFLTYFVGYLKINKFSTPRNRVLDKIPEPVKEGPNIGLYGSAEIVTSKKQVQKILSNTNRLNEIEIDDPGVYCGYYQCSTMERLLNLLIDAINKHTKFCFKKFSGSYCYIPDDCHVIIYGDTRAGKTRRVLLSTLHLISRGKNESFIIFDSKRELLALTSEKLREQGYDIKVYDFEHPQNSTRHNPLYVAIDLIKEGKKDEAMQEVSERVLALVDPVNLQGENKFFYVGAVDLIKAVTLAILLDDQCPEDQKTFTTVSRMLENLITKRPVNPSKPNAGKYSPFEEYIEVKFPMDSVVNTAYAPIKNTEDKYISNFISTAQQLMGIFRDPAIEDMTRFTENPFKNIAKRKQAVFIVAPSNKQAYKSLATMFLDQMYSEIRSEANEDNVVNGVHQVGRTTRRVNFICEEILSINPWEKLMDALNEGAGLGLRFFLIIQNQQLFNKKYGKEEAEGIKPNCATQMLITTGDTAETVSHWLKMIGTMTVESVSEVISGSRFSLIKSNKSKTTSACKRYCLDEAEIQGWDANCGILIKTKLHENVLNVPLPDVSCTPTEEYFGLGSKQDNLEKASKILQKSFRDNSHYQISKTRWLPGIKKSFSVKYSDAEIKKLLNEQNQKYIKAYEYRMRDRNNNNDKSSKKCAIAWNTITGEVITYENLKDFQKAVYGLKFSVKDGWNIKQFVTELEMNDFIQSINSTKKETKTLY